MKQTAKRTKSTGQTHRRLYLAEERVTALNLALTKLEMYKLKELGWNHAKIPIALLSTPSKQEVVEAFLDCASRRGWSLAAMNEEFLIMRTYIDRVRSR